MSFRFALLLTLSTSIFAQSSPNNDGGKIFNMSIEQLLELNLMGATIRDFGFNKVTKTNNPLAIKNQDISSTVEIIDSKSIKARGLKNVAEAVETLVGVTSGESPSEPYSFGMRGFKRDSVGILFDGIYIGASTLNMRPMPSYSIDRIEIIKGPTNLESTQGSSGGTINIITKDPKISKTTINKAVISLGDYNNKTVFIDSEGPIKESESAYYMGIHYNGSDGWVENSNSETFGFNTSFLWNKSENLNLIFKLNYLKDNLPAYWGTPLVPRSAANDPVDDIISSDDDLVIDRDSRFTNYNVKDNVIESEQVWQKLTLDWKIASDLKLKSTIYNFNAQRFWRNAESYKYNSGVIDRDRLLVDHDRNVYGVKSGINFNNSFGQYKNRFNINIEFAKNNFKRNVGYQAVADSVDTENPNQGDFGNIDKRKDTRFVDKTAFTFYDRLTINNKLSIDLNLKRETLFIDRTRFNYDGSTRSGSINRTFNTNSMFLGTSFKMSQNHTIYGHYSFQHGDVITDMALGVVDDLNDFMPSEVKQIEVGAKGRLNNKTEFSLGFYKIDKVIKTDISTISYNESSLTSKGVELAVNSELAKNLKTEFTYAYTDAAFDDYYDGIDSGVDVSGKTPFNVPKTIARLWLNYEKLFNAPLEVGGNVEYISRRYTTDSNNTSLNEYTLINLHSTYKYKKNYHFSLHLKNLTDKVYSPWSDLYYPNQIILGAPRRVELSFNSSF